jgi:hypothetical protein
VQPPDTAALEQALWAAFVEQLANHLAGQWPAMPERLGERYTAFVEHAVQQADKRGITRAAAVARYVNLWFVWGPLFHDKPGFEWALGLLAAPRQQEWSTLHRLVRRSLAELQRLPDTRIEPAALAAADERLIDAFGHLGRRGDMQPAEPAPVPRRACDLEAVELRLIESAVAQHYLFEAGQWRQAALPPPAPLRIDAANGAPRLIGVLAHPPGGQPQARLQLRSRTHALCDGDVHPALSFAGTHGRWQWQGHETTAVSWPLATLAQADPVAGPGTAIAEETSPDIFALDLQVCGLRDEGDALGALRTRVWVWPAAQWWLELQREAAAAQPVLANQAPTLRPATRCRVECDAQPLEAAALRDGFERGLDLATAAALQRLMAAWAGVEGLAAPRLDGSLALLTGRAAFTWGWQLGPNGLDGRAFMRLLGQMNLQACQAELLFEGELALDGARARLRLHCMGATPLKQQLQREAADPPLLPVMQAARTTFRLPFTAELTPLASDTGALLMAAGPCTGALVGEAGLRPRTSGGSGWEWFASMRLEAASLTLQRIDPVLGACTADRVLWPEQGLLDWRLA